MNGYFFIPAFGAVALAADACRAHAIAPNPSPSHDGQRNSWAWPSAEGRGRLSTRQMVLATRGTVLCRASGGVGSDRMMGGYGMGEDQAARRGRPIDETDLRRALGQFATGITVVTTRDHKRRPRAITVNAFSSLSLDPPLVLYCLGRSAFHFKVFADAKAFAINVLAADQEALSSRFAREDDDAFADLAVTELATGSPILRQCLAVLDCETEAIHEAGDHLIIVGRVTAIDRPGGSDPLIYYRGAYRGLRP